MTERIEQLERDGEFAEQLFVHGLGVQAAEGLAEWNHAEVRSALEIDPGRGRRYSWGYPACPEQSEHTKLWKLLDLDEIGMTLSDGYAVMPEQSTVAIIAHHPQAVYFGMKSGFIPEEAKTDELIAGTDRGGELPPDEEFEGDGSIEAEADEPRRATAASRARSPQRGRRPARARTPRGARMPPGSRAASGPAAREPRAAGSGRSRG